MTCHAVRPLHWVAELHTHLVVSINIAGWGREGLGLRKVKQSCARGVMGSGHVTVVSTACINSTCLEQLRGIKLLTMAMPRRASIAAILNMFQ